MKRIIAFCAIFAAPFLAKAAQTPPNIATNGIAQYSSYRVAWTGAQEPTDQDNRDLAGLANDPAQMEQFITDHPDSPWTPGLRNALAVGNRQSGRNTKALEQWGATWAKLKDDTNSVVREEANHALAGQLQLLSSLGRVDTLRELLAAAQDREVADPNDRQRIETAREAYLIMVDHPTLSYRCGSLALANIARIESQPASTISALIEEPSTVNGISLKRLVQLNQQFGLGLVAVKRTDKTPVPVPAVIHWAQNHYGAIVEYKADVNYYRVVDPTFKNDLWISAADLAAESDGYFLVPENKKPTGWFSVSDEESAQVFGRGYPYNIDDTKDRGCKFDPTNPTAKCIACGGMPVWWVSEPYINVWFADEPWTYTTSRGEQMALHLSVKQRDTQGTLYTYTRPGVQHNWYSRLYIQGMPDSVPVGAASSNWTATLYMPTGGQITYTKNNPYDEGSKTRLDTVYGTMTDGTVYDYPSWGGNLNISGFRVYYPDGSMDVYGLMNFRDNTTLGYYESEALLTSHRDALGNTTTLNYSAYSNSHFAPGQTTYQLYQVTDYDGKTTTFTYSPSNPDLLYQVTSPYGQTATFGFDANTNLTSIVDAVSLTNQFAWDSQGRVTNLVTPYGTNAFLYYQNVITNEGNIGGHNAITRAVTVTDAAGGTNIYAFRFDCSGFFTNTQYTGSDVPTNTPLGTLDTGATNASTTYAAVSFRNSFHWNPMQVAALSTLNLTNLTATDYLKGRMQHWLGDSNNVAVLDQISVEQEPSPDGSTPGQKTFYDYFGKTLNYLQGTNSQVSVTARRQPSGKTEYTWSSLNNNGFTTNIVSTYELADGVVRTRTNTLTYGANVENFVLVNSLPAYFVSADGVGYALTLGNYPGTASTDFGVPNFAGVLAISSDAATSSYTNANILLASKNPSGAAIQYGGYSTTTETPSISYTVWYYDPGFPGVWSREPYPLVQTIIHTYIKPLPTTVTNEAGYVTSISYNANSEVSSIHSASGLTTANLYDPTGFLTNTVDNEIGRANSYSYTNGLVYVHQDELGRLTTNFWDNLQRLTGTADAEGSTSNRYLRLDLAATKNKLGNWTYLGYDPLRNLVALTNANQEVSLSEYCQCGALEWTRDALNNYTYFNYDLAGRLTSILYADGYSITNKFNSLDQAVQTADSLGTVNNTFNVQGLTTSVANNAGLLRSNSFDILDRPIAVTDAEGVVTTTSFDTLGRPLTNMVSGQFTNTYVYSSNGLVKFTDSLSHFMLIANDAAGRVLAHTNANGEVVQFQYNPAGSITNLTDGKTQHTYFQFDQFGRLTNKLNNTSTSMLRLAYNANSQTVSRWTPAQGTNIYIRDTVGRVRTNGYTTGPSVVFAYDSDGHLTNMVDAFGTTSWTYTSNGLVQTETGPWANSTVSIGYSNRLRSSLSLQQPGVASWVQTYAYDSSRRLTGTASPAGVFAYGYDPTRSPLITQIALPNFAFITNHYDTLARLDSTALVNFWGHTLDGYNYAYNSVSLRTNITRNLGLTTNIVTAGFDNIGQITSWTAKESSGVARLNEQLGYGFDAADSLHLRTNGTLVQAFNADGFGLNQISNITRSGLFTLSGALPAPTLGVSVNGAVAQTNGDFTFAANGISLTSGNNTFNVIATNVYGVRTTNAINANLPTIVTMQFDSNGNLTNDGTRSFSYDTEDRLSSVLVAGLWRTDFIYDGLGRRRIERDYAWQSSAWAETNEMRILYDGLLPIQERDGNNVPQVTYTRGLDLSGSLFGQGGVGGLLARTDSAGATTFYHADGIGNITALIDETEDIVARYEYDPFGRLMGQWGTMADLNRYRFSSQNYFPNAGLYGYYARYYDPAIQRWLNRDPIAEAGGMNLYGFVGNNPLGNIDPLGLTWYDYIPGIGVGIRQAQGESSVQAQLKRMGYDSMAEYQLDHPGYNGTLTSGNAQAVSAAANLAAGATQQYVNVAQAIVPVGIATRGTEAAAQGIADAAEQGWLSKLWSKCKFWNKSTTPSPGLRGIVPLDLTRYAPSASTRLLSPGVADGTYAFVQDVRGNVWVADNLPHMHPQILGNATPVASAGEITVQDGVVTGINNISGTFKPSPSTLNRVQGAAEMQGMVVSPTAIQPFVWPK